MGDAVGAASNQGEQPGVACRHEGDLLRGRRQQRRVGGGGGTAAP